MVKNASLTDRLVSALSYVTMGWAGVIYSIFLCLLKKRHSNFLLFNIMQAVFVSFLFFVLAMVLGLLRDILSFVPIINTYILAPIDFMLFRPFIFSYSILQIIVFSIVIFMAAVSFLGIKPKIPFISQIVERASR